MLLGFPGGSVVKNLPTNAEVAGDMSSIPRLARSPGVGNGNRSNIRPGKSHGQRRLAGYSLGVAKRQTQLSK